MQVGERNIIYLLSIAKLPSGRRRGCWGPGRLRMFASADSLAEGRSLSLDQTVPRQLKLSSKKGRTQLLSSPLVLRHQEKIKEATEPAQSTLPSPVGPEHHPHPPRTLRQPGPGGLRCAFTVHGGTRLTPFPSRERPFLLGPGLCHCQPRTKARARLPPSLVPGAQLTVCSSACARASELSSFWGPRRLGSCLGGA